MSRQIINFLFFTLLQVFIMKDLVLFNTGFSFAYIGFLLLVPLDKNISVSLLMAFLYGLFMDIFTDSYGINAAACVLLVYVRPRLVKLLFSNRPGSDDLINPSVEEMGINSFSFYVLLLAFIHHLVLFYSEAFSTNAFFLTFWKVIISSLFTTLIIVLSQYLFFYSKNKRWVEDGSILPKPSLF